MKTRTVVGLCVVAAFHSVGCSGDSDVSDSDGNTWNSDGEIASAVLGAVYGSDMRAGTAPESAEDLAASPRTACAAVPGRNVFPRGNAAGADWETFNATATASDVASTGSQALKICATDAELVHTLEMELFDDSSLVAGKTYELGFCARSAPGEAAPQQVTLGLTVTVDGELSGESAGGVHDFEDGWIPARSGTVTIPAGATGPTILSVQGFSDGGADTCVIIDEIYVVESE